MCKPTLAHSYIYLDEGPGPHAGECATALDEQTLLNAHIPVYLYSILGTGCQRWLLWLLHKAAREQPSLLGAPSPDELMGNIDLSLQPSPVAWPVF